jgi:hypothetical protein
MRRVAFWVGLLLAWNAVFLVATFGLMPTSAHASAPQLWLPTPVGERWQVTQGFQCGSHVGTQSRSLDLVNLDGSTTGAPIRAAADGTTFVWQGSTGTLIIAHGDGYYTMYTHLQQVITTRRGLDVRRGDVIGRAGSVGTGMPHLHFTFFYAPDRGAYDRTSLELDFADGYSFHDRSGCNQHRGVVVVARAEPDTTPPDVHFRGEVEPNQWYCEDQRVDFTIEDDVRVEGFSQAFNRDPGGAAPEFDGDTGYVQISWEGDGLKTLHVRAWDHNGQQTLATFGPVGFDDTAPSFTEPETLPTHTYTAGKPMKLSWTPADDGEGSGVAGYRLYLGSEIDGTDDWFSAQASVKVKGLEPGRYFLRGQALDNGCKSSDWITLQHVVVTAADETTPEEAATATSEATATAQPVEPTATQPPEATATPETVEPTATPEATATAQPVEPTATQPPKATATSEPTATPEATVTQLPKATATSEPTATQPPKATATPEEEADLPPTSTATSAATAETGKDPVTKKPVY